jgi:hypothetical protein
MKSNSLLTYLLYALLGTLILSAGYKMCQMQKEKQRKAKEEAEWQETLKKLYPEGDTTGGGSAFINRDSTAQTNGAKTGVSPSGIEGATATTGGGNGTTAPSATTTAPKSTTKSSAKVQGVGSGKWEVRAGTFQYMEGARTRLEEVIRVGYTNAEIRKKSDGKAMVIVMRSNDKNKATQTADQLVRRGIDAGVFVTGK